MTSTRTSVSVENNINGSSAVMPALHGGSAVCELLRDFCPQRAVHCTVVAPAADLHLGVQQRLEGGEVIHTLQML